MRYFYLTGVLLCAQLLSTPLFAEERYWLGSVVVQADRSDSLDTLTAPGNDSARRALYKTPGGVALVEADDFESNYSLGFDDTLSLVPGVYAQKRFGEEVRLSIRGSGLSRGFHLRGLTLLQDGIPFNLADGSADFQEADSLAFGRLEVFKGANALQYGATTLGGAINMVSKTGASQSGDSVRFEVGADHTYRANVQSGRMDAQLDRFFSLTTTRSNGSREHSAQHNAKFNANMGWVLSESAETRFYVSANSIEQKLPGTVGLANALSNREQANPASITHDWARDIQSLRVANRTAFLLSSGHQLDVGGFLNLKDLHHPITPFVGVIDQESVDYGVFAQWAGETSVFDLRSDYRAGVTSHLGKVDAKVFQNNSGVAGALRSDSDLNSVNVVFFGENSLYLNSYWVLVTGGQLIWSDRESRNQTNPAGSDGKTFTGFNPKFGFLYQPNQSTQIFANVSRSYEVPTFSELTQGGAAGFTPVQAQRAWTVELGSRGQSDRFAWDFSIYRAWLDGELLQFSTGPGIPASTFNAKDTIHQGVELGLEAWLVKGLFQQGDQLIWRNAYTFSDYYFDNDLQYGNNEIAGQPRHFYQTELNYQHPAGWAFSFDWELASKADVDFSNTLEAPGYGVLGVATSFEPHPDLSLFVEIRNLLDKKYVSTFSTLVDSTGNTDVFYPAAGTSVFGGVRLKF